MPKNVVCKKCNNLVNDWCEKVIDSPDQDMQRDCQYFCEKTNADRIRAMSDEELAAWLTRIANGDVYTDFCCNPARTVVCDSKCVVCIAEWLKHPAKDGDDDD